MAHPVTILQSFTIILWLAAGIVHVVNIFQYPAEQRKERLYYILPILSYILHVVVFYAIVIITNWGVPQPATTEGFRNWSAILRLHGAFALGIKEVVAYYRQSLKNKLGVK